MLRLPVGFGSFPLTPSSVSSAFVLDPFASFCRCTALRATNMFNISKGIVAYRIRVVKSENRSAFPALDSIFSLIPVGICAGLNDFDHTAPQKFYFILSAARGHHSPNAGCTNHLCHMAIRFVFNPSVILYHCMTLRTSDIRAMFKWIVQRVFCVKPEYCITSPALRTILPVFFIDICSYLNNLNHLCFSLRFRLINLYVSAG